MSDDKKNRSIVKKSFGFKETDSSMKAARASTFNVDVVERSEAKTPPLEEEKKPVVRKPFLKRGEGQQCLGNKAKSIEPAKRSQGHKRMDSDQIMDIKRPKSNNGMNTRRGENVSALEMQKQSVSSEPVNNNTLDKKINFYNSELEKLKAKNANLEEREKNFRLKERELELKNKSAIQEVDRYREEEMLKIRKEKKVLEQRNKNISYNKNTNEAD